MKIYTRSGDDGTTGLFGGPRVSKNDARIEAYGTVDELNAALGAVRDWPLPEPVDAQIEQVQHELFSLGAELATPDPCAHDLDVIGTVHIERLGAGGSMSSRIRCPRWPISFFPLGFRGPVSFMFPAPCARRAERHVVALASHADAEVSSHLIVYLNRLSDLLFVHLADHESAGRASGCGMGSSRARRSQRRLSHEVSPCDRTPGPTRRQTRPAWGQVDTCGGRQTRVGAVRHLWGQPRHVWGQADAPW